PFGSGFRLTARRSPMTSTARLSLLLLALLAVPAAASGAQWHRYDGWRIRDEFRRDVREAARAAARPALGARREIRAAVRAAQIEARCMAREAAREARLAAREARRLWRN